MRRAVAEQIKALEELNEIVTRSGRAYDVSQPAPLMLAAPRRRSRPGAWNRRARRDSHAGSRAVLARRAAKTASQPLRPANAKTSERGGGWISDLLARVDSDEPRPAAGPSACGQIPPAKPAQPAQRLDTFSLDVAQMIDHAAAASAWDRYRRGDNNAFTRRIYVGRGPQTFDEIRRRYRLDPEFRAHG